MSRIASVIGILFGVIFMGATALYPCLPAKEPTGEIFALSRFDFALVHLAHPQAIWSQWTNHGKWDFWSVRSQSIVPFAVQLLVVLSMGYSLLIGAGLSKNLSRLSAFCLAYVSGYSLVQFLHYPQLAVLGHVSSWGTLVLINCVIGVSLAIGWWRARSTSRLKELALDSGEFRTVPERLRVSVRDESLNEPWRRRLMGLFFLGCAVVMGLQILGAMLPSVDDETRKGTWSNTLHALDKDSRSIGQSYWTEFDTLAYVWMDMLNVNWRHDVDSSSANASSLGTPAHYPILIGSKLLLFGAFLAGHCLLWQLFRFSVGKLPALMTCFLLLTSPALVELSRFGRNECLVYASIAAVLYLVCDRTKGEQRFWSLVLVCSLPLAEHVFIVAQLPRNEEEIWIDPFMRFLGFSPLYSVAFIASVVLGALAIRTRWNWGSLALGCLWFLIVGFLGSRTDRSWVPCIGFLAVPASFGVDWMIKQQTRWIGLPIWCIVLVLSMVNVAVWPTMENRILASASDLVAERWEYPEDDTQTKTTSFVKEIRKLHRSGEIDPMAKILMLGTKDDLDIPVRCKLVDSSDDLGAHLADMNTTHIALVSPKDGNRRIIPLEKELALRTKLQELVATGALRPQTISDECFELSLFVVRR